MTIKQLRSATIALSAIVFASLVPPTLQAQTLASRIASVRDGKVRFTFPARSDYCGFNNGISHGSNNRMNWSSDVSSDVEYDDECSHGPVRIVLLVSNGKVDRLRTYIGGNWRPVTSGVTDLGAVTAKEGTDYLFSLAASNDGSAARDAILPITLAAEVSVWPGLLGLVKNQERPKGVRSQAMFWLAVAAGDRLVGSRASLANDKETDEVKKSAVFALSQRRNDEAVPALIDVARNNRDPQIRKSAMFWLGQTLDPRAISLFEDVLRSRN
jgi:hypothetical protein